MSCYFISGHTDLSSTEFMKKYGEKIREAAGNEQSTFVVGDSNGVDAFAQDYLYQLGVDKSQVTVYHIGSQPRNNINSWPTKGGFRNHSQKDAAMTQSSNVDILYIRSEEESRALYGSKYRPRISGTQKNLERRQKL